MTPKINNQQKHKLTAITLNQVKVGDIVFCKVKGNYFTHLVTGINEKRGIQISNNHGHVNG